LGATVGYWNFEDDDPRTIARACVGALDSLSRSGIDGYLSLKAPVLEPDLGAVDAITTRARELGIDLHLDSLWPEAVDLMFELVARAGDAGVRTGCTLPAAWDRSTSDAERAIGSGCHRIRLVKGQWQQSRLPLRELRSRYLSLVARLAGAAGPVAVATHDTPLAGRALRALLDAGTPCELELLVGLPPGPALRAAAALGVPVRVYVPFGRATAPYSRELRRSAMAWYRLLTDAMRSAGGSHRWFGSLPPGR
jgi:proline dehydrogenase